jgi:SAM-dependent methyltransferase
MSEVCDYCGGSDLEQVYAAPTTARALSIYLCRDCALVQSLPRIDNVSQRSVAVSAGADWGNVRYGKAFRTEQALRTAASVRDLAALDSVLDIGANRGSFVLRVHEAAPQARILAVEPDASLIEEYRDIAGIDLQVARIEQVALAPAQYDLIYCNHTLEHVRSAMQLLRQARAAVKPDGVLLLEVPNIAFIGRDDVVEEWFIDKHLYHFSVDVLCDMLRSAAWRIDEGRLAVDDENISVVAYPSEQASGVARDLQAVRCHRARTIVQKYRHTLVTNHAALKRAASVLEREAAGKRIVVWGAGRIFDSLVRVGQLQVACLAGVVDKHLVDRVDAVHGLPLRRPEQLRELQPDLVVIASREYLGEIRQALTQMLPDCKSVGLHELLAAGTEAGRLAS